MILLTKIINSAIIGISAPIMAGVSPYVCKQIKQSIKDKKENDMLNSLSTTNYDSANNKIEKNLTDDINDLEVNKPEIYWLNEDSGSLCTCHFNNNKHNVSTYEWSDTYHLTNDDYYWKLPKYYDSGSNCFSGNNAVKFSTKHDSESFRQIAQKFYIVTTVPPHSKTNEYNVNIECQLYWHSNAHFLFLSHSSMDYTCELFNFGSYGYSPVDIHPYHFSNANRCNKNQFDCFSSDLWSYHYDLSTNDEFKQNFELSTIIKSQENSFDQPKKIYSEFMLSFLVEGLADCHPKNKGSLDSKINIAKKVHGNSAAQTEISNYDLLETSIIEDTFSDKNWNKKNLSLKYQNLKDTYNNDLKLNKDKLKELGIKPEEFKWNSADEFADDLIKNKEQYKKKYLENKNINLNNFITTRKSDLSGWFNTELSINDSVGIKVKKVENNTINTNSVNFNELTDYSSIYPSKLKQKIDYDSITNNFYVNFNNDEITSDSFVMYIPIKAKVTLPYKIIDCYYDFVPCLSIDFNACLQKEGIATKKDHPYIYTVQLYDFEDNKSIYPQNLAFGNKLNTNFTNLDKNLIYLNDYNIDTQYIQEGEGESKCSWSDLYSHNKGNYDYKLFHQQKNLPSYSYSTKVDNEQMVEFEAYYGVAITIQGAKDPWRKLIWNTDYYEDDGKYVQQNGINFVLQLVDKEQCLQTDDNKYKAIAYESNKKSENKIYLSNMNEELNQIGYKSTPEGGLNGLIFTPTKNKTSTRAFFQRTKIKTTIPANSCVFLEISISPSSLFNRTSGNSWWNTHFENCFSLFKLSPNQPNPEWIPGIDYKFDANNKTDEESLNGLIFSQTNKDFVKHNRSQILISIGISIAVIAVTLIASWAANKLYCNHLYNEMEAQYIQQRKDTGETDLGEIEYIRLTHLSDQVGKPLSKDEFSQNPDKYPFFKTYRDADYANENLRIDAGYQEYMNIYINKVMHYPQRPAALDYPELIRPKSKWLAPALGGIIAAVVSASIALPYNFCWANRNIYRNAMPDSSNITFNNSYDFNADGTLKSDTKTAESIGDYNSNKNQFVFFQPIFNTTNQPKEVQFDFGIGFVHNAQDSKEKGTSSILNAAIQIKKYGFVYLA